MLAEQESETHVCHMQSPRLYPMSLLVPRPQRLLPGQNSRSHTGLAVCDPQPSTTLPAITSTRSTPQISPIWLLRSDDCLLSAYHVPGTILGTWQAAVKQRDSHLTFPATRHTFARLFYHHLNHSIFEIELSI